MSTSTRPFVSVVTPTYNRREFLPTLIHLYKQQTYPHNMMELVILDDSDESNEDLIPKDDPSIRYYYERPKLVLGDKRNKLYSLAKGDVIVCFDDDDYHYPERVAHSIVKLNSQKSEIAGTTTLRVYYADIDKLYEYGPFGPTHGTNGTFAFKKSYLKSHKHDPEAHAQEEASFTNRYTSKLCQLDQSKTIICISHDYNTYDKRVMLKQERTDRREIKTKLNTLIKDKKYLAFIKEFSDKVKIRTTEKITEPEKMEEVKTEFTI